MVISCCSHGIRQSKQTRASACHRGVAQEHMRSRACVCVHRRSVRRMCFACLLRSIPKTPMRHRQAHQLGHPDHQPGENNRYIHDSSNLLPFQSSIFHRHGVLVHSRFSIWSLGIPLPCVRIRVRRHPRWICPAPGIRPCLPPRTGRNMRFRICGPTLRVRFGWQADFSIGSAT